MMENQWKARHAKNKRTGFSNPPKPVTGSTNQCKMTKKWQEENFHWAVDLYTITNVIEMDISQSAEGEGTVYQDQEQIQRGCSGLAAPAF